MSQLSYSINITEGVAGLPAFACEPSTILTHNNPVDAIAWGKAVAKVSGTDGAIKLPSLVGDAILGVAIRDTSSEGTSYPALSAVAVLRRGQISVTAEQAVTADDPVYVRYAGRNQVQTVVFSADVVTGNSIALTVNGTALTQAFTTDNATTLAALAVQIAAVAALPTAVSDGTHTITVTASTHGVPVVITGGLVTGGASQPTIAVTQTVVGVLDSAKGNFRMDADSSTAVLVPSGRYLKTATAGALTIVDLNIA